MDDLFAFVGRCLDEDEQVARAVPCSEWKHVDKVRISTVGGCECGCECEPVERVEIHYHWLDIGPGRQSRRMFAANSDGPNELTPDGELTPDEAEHMARWDPARVLAEIEAKRRILDEARHWMWNDDRGGPDPMSAAAVRLLAVPYANRDGYREEWRP